MYLIVGLGNPGPQYIDTRHNLGFMVIEDLRRRLGLGLALKRQRFALVGEGRVDDHKIILAAPQTFMNNSGLAVRELLRWHKLAPSNLMVAYDDVDLEVGALKIRMGGGAAGHHGIESIIKAIGTPEFMRVRIGIGRESLTGDVTEYVLSKIPPSERPLLDEAVVRASEAALVIISEGLPAAMGRFNESL